MTIPPTTKTKESQSQTLKLKGIVKNRKVTILIDYGSTLNCIDINVTKQINLFVYPSKDLIVRVVNGYPVNNIG